MDTIFSCKVTFKEVFPEVGFFFLNPNSLHESFLPAFYNGIFSYVI